MSTAAEDLTTESAAPARADAVTPTLRATFRRWRFWIVTLALVVVAVIVYNLASSTGRDTTPFGAANAGPAGARALVEVLRAQGVDVRVATRLDDAASVGSAPATTTLLISDPNLLLDTGRLDEFDGIADDIVLVAPDNALLDRYAPGVALGGTPEADEPLEAGCTVPAATRAGSMTASEGSVNASGDTSAPAVAFCFTDSSGRSQIALAPRPGTEGTTTVIAGTGPFENDGITSAGNASLALGLLGASPTLIWYEPGFDDLLPGTVPPTTAELTPEWVTPVLVLLLAVALAAAVWRGRRFGPLVVENLPVVVRAGETIEGRARLYRRGSARLHALDSLRIGTVSRLARLLGLPRSADVDAVCAATADRLGRPPAEIRSLLLDDVPATDADLVAAGNALTDLERRVAATLGER